jgi:HEAT repeat protein
MRKPIRTLLVFTMILFSFALCQRSAAEEKETAEEQLLLRVLRDDLAYLDDNRPIRARIADLKNADFKVRAMTAYLLAHSGRKAKTSVPAVALKDQNADVRAMAAYGLAGIGPDARPAVPALLETIHDRAPMVRAYAALALGAVRPAAKTALPPLLEALKDKDADVRSCAARALGGFGAETGPAVSLLIAALADRNARVRHDAAYAFRGIGPTGRDAVAPLAKLVKNKDEERDTRRNAIHALGAIGANAKDAVPVLVEALKDADNNVRRDVAGALGDIGPGAKGAVPTLLEALKKTADWEHQIIIEALGKIGPEAKAAVPALLEELKSDDADARLAAAWSLTRISRRHEAQAVAELRKLRKHEHAFIWTKAASALLRLSPADEEAATAQLLLGLKEKTTRLTAVWALRENGPEAKALVPELLALWRDDKQNEDIGDAVAEALKRIDPAAAKRAGVP